ncbi:MAG TPA: 1-phosphofructokinase [Epulopiscium sp.]|nr:1-phosphofructokinase [Candidatus Epulonipiscium sp.]
MRKIIIVALNPAMDKTIKINGLELGRVNRISEVRYDIGGKGVNVSALLMEFGIKSIVTGFLGGHYSDLFKDRLMKKGIETKFFKVLEDTRVNTKIIDTATGMCTDINEQGPYVPEEVLERFLKSFSLMCKEEDIIVLTGGASPGVPVDIYGTLTSIAKSKGAFVLLDADGDLLKYGIAAGPDIIKPNQYEFFQLKGKEDLTRNEILAFAATLRADGLGKILLSLGSKGAMYLTEGGTYYAPSVNVNVISPVGAGDAMVASLVYSKLQGLDDEQTLRYAVACGAATVTLEGTQICTARQVSKLLEIVKIHII